MEALVHNLILTIFVAAAMLWNIFWALALGFALSGAVAVFVPASKLKKLLGRADWRGLAAATLLGAASSSCSYAAASTSRRLFEKGAHFTAAMAFMLASTNLVAELSAVLWSLMGWQFVAAEFAGGLLMIAIMAFIFKLISAERRALGASAPHHGAHDDDQDSAKLFSLDGWTRAAKIFVSEVSMIWKDIALGLGISAALMVWVPDTFWRALFFDQGNSLGGLIGNAMVGPLVSILSFTCSVGNIPLAAVLYQKGIGFAGTLSFIYADLLIIPLILVYRKYYGRKTALKIVSAFYVAMVAAAIAIDLIFQTLHWIPDPTRVMAMAMPTNAPGGLNHTFWLNLIFALITAALLILSRRNRDKGAESAHDSCCH